MPKKKDGEEKTRQLTVNLSGGNLASLIDPFLRQLKLLHNDEELLPIQTQYQFLFKVGIEKKYERPDKEGWLPENAGPPVSTDTVKRDITYIKSKEVKTILHTTTPKKLPGKIAKPK